MDMKIIISNFNFCPQTQTPTLGTACLDCEYVNKVGDEYFCLGEEDVGKDALSVKEIIDALLELLMAGHTTIDRDEMIRLITDL